MRRFPWILTVLCAVSFVLLCSLGAWQVQRLQWKQGLIARAESVGRLPVAPFQEALPLEEFRRLRVSCIGLASAPFVEVRTIEDGQAGVRLVSVCDVAEPTTSILVDRGFVADAISARPPVVASDAPVTIDAQVREIPRPSPITPSPQGRTFFALDAARMAEALGTAAPPRPLILFATTSSNPEWRALEPSAPPAAFSNNHLGYALTWFGLALALVGFYIALLRRKLKS